MISARAAAAAALLLCAPLLAAENPPDAWTAARADVRRAFLAGAEGPDPASLPEPRDESQKARAAEVRALARELNVLRAGTTPERVAGFSLALDPASRPAPGPEALALYLRTPGAAVSNGGRDAALQAARLRERVNAAMRTSSALLAAGLPLPGESAPAVEARPPYVPTERPVRRVDRVLVAAPIFASAERGAVAAPVNAAARTEVALLDARTADYAARRDEAWASGRPLSAAGLAAVGAAGHVLRGTWSLVAAATGKDSAKNIARAVLYQPAAMMDYGERQSALPSPSDAPARYAAGTALNLAFLGVETLPGGRLAKHLMRWNYRDLAHESRDSLHRLQAAGEELANARGAEAEAARARFDAARAELDGVRKRMVEFRMSYALDHEFHGRIDSRLLERKDVSALNARFVREGGSPPFHSEVALYEVSVTKPIELCRTHRAADLSALKAVRRANGDWFIPCEMLLHHDQKHLRDLLALPDTNATDYVARYAVPAGTKFYVGAAGPIRGETSSRVEAMYTDAEGRAVGGGGNGGKLQFFLDPHINAPDARGAIAYAHSEPVPGSDSGLLAVLDSFRRAAETGDRAAARRVYRDFSARRRALADKTEMDEGLRLDYERVDAHMRERFPAALKG